MADGNQLSFGDGLLSNRRKISKLSKYLAKHDQIIDWQPLSGSQKKETVKLNSVRAAVEHTIAWMRTKKETRNRQRCVFTCIIGWNLSRAGFLLEKSKLLGSVA